MSALPVMVQDYPGGDKVIGTNFYFLFQDKPSKEKWFSDEEVRLVDSPDFGYEVHLAKTSCGWLPLFQAHRRINSVALMKQAYDDIPGCNIVDENGIYYDWAGFKDRALDFNKGLSETGDPDDCKRGSAISHLLYEHGRYRDEYWKDAEGYEFTEREFS